MARQPGSRTDGRSFDPSTVSAVWSKGQTVPTHDPAQHRKDRCGAWMQRADYGATTQYGWEIDHVKPVSQGGTDDLANLQPLQWQNNRGKSDNYPDWKCTIG